MAKSSAYKRIHEIRSSVTREFADYWDAAEENKRFYRLLQYSDAQLQKHTKRGTVPRTLGDSTCSIWTSCFHPSRPAW